jgi:hypothetical protein
VELAVIYRRAVHNENTRKWAIEKRPVDGLSHPWRVIPPGSRGQSVRVSCFRTGEDALKAFSSYLTSNERNNT